MLFMEAVTVIRLFDNNRVSGDAMLLRFLRHGLSVARRWLAGESDISRLWQYQPEELVGHR